MERWSTQVHSLGYYYNVSMTARYTSPPGQRLTRQILFNALEAVIRVYAPLGLTILDENTAKPRFARLKSIDLDQAVTFIKLSGQSEEAQQEEFDQIFAKQHSMSFHRLGELPVWRILVIEPEKYDATARGVDVSFVYHHAIGDGASGQTFHMALLKALDSPPSTVGEMQTPYVITPPPLQLLGPLETLVPLPLTLIYLLRTMWTRVWFPPTPSPTFWCGTPIHVTPGGLKTTFRTITFPAHIVTPLLAACRAEKTTVTALLQILIAARFFAALPEKSTSTLASTIAVNLRRAMPESVTDETMGVFVCSSSSKHSRAAFERMSIWELARGCRKQLESRVRAGTRNADVGLLRHVGDFEKHFRGRIGKPHEYSFEISNLGVFKGKGAGGWDIPTRVVFSQSANVASCPVDFSVISVKGGDLVVAISFQEGGLEPELMKRVVDGLKSEVEKIAGVGI